MQDLNEQQRAAVCNVDGPLLVLAGAGSGKTRVITQKIAYLINSKDFKARQLVAVTFTNKAAREMKQRVAKLVEPAKRRGLIISTFHHFGLRILRKECQRLGYRTGFSIFDSQDSLGLIREVLRNQTPVCTAPEGLVKDKISAWKNHLVTPQQAIASAQDALDLQAALAYQEYNQYLQTYNAFDFDDLIAQPVWLFRNDAACLAHWQTRTRYLLVDEYQDTNLCQYELVKLLVGTQAAFTVVGDDDQSIYTWRGARPENLQQLNDDFPQLSVIKLEQNYRSSGCILRAANQLIAQNPHLFQKRLWSELGYGEPIQVLACKDEEHEASRIVSEILHYRFTHRTPYSDFAILFRGNYQSRPFEKVLREHRIPYFLSGGTSFFQRTEIKDIMGYLRILVNEDDDQAFLRIANIPRREIGTTTLRKLSEFAASQHTSLFEACFADELNQHLDTRAALKIRNFAQWLSDTQDRVQRSELIPSLFTMLDELGYQDWLEQESKDEKAAQRRYENVLELMEWLKRMHEKEDKEKTLAELVSTITLIDILDQQQEENESDALVLMTLHAAKGLEFPHVFIPGMEEELLPHRQSIEDDNLEEERRLAYVGITRAQKTLTFTVTAKRRKAGEWFNPEPSRFLSELPEQDLQWERQQTDQAGQRTRGKAHLAHLKDMLNED